MSAEPPPRPQPGMRAYVTGPGRYDAEPAPPPRPPRPGHGTVFVRALHGEWLASWQDEGRHADVTVPTRDAALAWARSRGAARVRVLRPDGNGWDDDGG